MKTCTNIFWKFTFLFLMAFLFNSPEANAACPPGYRGMPTDLIESNGYPDTECVKNEILNVCDKMTSYRDTQTPFNSCVTGYHSYDAQGTLESNPHYQADRKQYGSDSDKSSSATADNTVADSYEDIIDDSFSRGSCAAGKYEINGSCASRSQISSCIRSAGSYMGDRFESCVGGAAGSASVGGCDAAYQQLASACTDKSKTATNRCDENADSGISSWAQKLEAGTALAQGTSNQVGINSACSQISTALSGVNAAIASFQGICEYNISSCQSSCQKAMDDASAKGCMDTSAVQSGLSSCQALKSKAQKIASSLQSSVQNAQMAKACSQSTAGTMEALCRANPSMPGCANSNTTDCSLPENANNLVCKCQANPYDTACGYNTNAAGGTTTQASQISRKGDSTVDVGGLDFNQPQIDPVTGKGGAAAGAVGKQGGGVNMNVGGGGSSGSGGEGSGGGGSGMLANILNGFRGGGSIGGMFGRGNSGSNGARGGYGAGSGSAAKNGQPDLRQFLPGGSMHKRRGVSGSYAGPDGITGPHGSIWQKVNIRYKVLQSSLLP